MPKEQVTVTLTKNFDITKPVGSVTIDKDLVPLLKDCYIGAGYIQQGKEVGELLELSVCELWKLPMNIHHIRTKVEMLDPTEKEIIDQDVIDALRSMRDDIDWLLDRALNTPRI